MIFIGKRMNFYQSKGLIKRKEIHKINATLQYIIFIANPFESIKMNFRIIQQGQL